MGELLPPDDEYTTLCKQLDDGRHACIVPMTFGKYRICVSTDDSHLGYDDGW